MEVDLAALRHNVAVIRQTIGADHKLGLVAKADAYGHGLVPVGRFAIQNGVDWLCVATVQEGIALRDAGIEAPLLVLSPILPIEAEQAVFYRLRVQVEDMLVVDALSEAALRQDTKAHVHLKVDTGISRFGATPVEASDLAIAISRTEGIDLEGISTHFADSANDPERTAGQMRKFQAVLDVCRSQGIHFRVIHEANSAGTIRFPAARQQLVRVGIAAYGINPYGLEVAQPLVPVMTWKARIMGIRTRPAGTWVSYGSTRQLDRNTRIATLGVGYGDGYPRGLSNTGAVLVGGARCAVLGLVCMDQILVDVTDVAAEVGDDAELLGKSILVPELAAQLETNSHEVITRIMSRVPRRYIHPAG